MTTTIDSVPKDSSVNANVAVQSESVPQIDIPELFNVHRHHLLRFIQRYLNNSADAEDVLQNTFLEAFRCADRFAGLSKPSTWLFGIALNQAHGQVRRNCGDKLELMDELQLSEFADEHADPAKIIQVRQMTNKVNEFLGDLSPKIRTTFEAVLEGDISYEEAAKQLQIPIGTVRSRISRVRASVRAEFS